MPLICFHQIKLTLFCCSKGCAHVPSPWPQQWPTPKAIVIAASNEAMRSIFGIGTQKVCRNNRKRFQSPTRKITSPGGQTAFTSSSHDAATGETSVCTIIGGRECVDRMQFSCV